MIDMTEYIACADIHISEDRPRYRKDDYFNTGLRKLSTTVDISNQCDARLLIAGDIFNSSRASTNAINRVIEVLQKATYTPIAVVGQHDLRFHSGRLTATPIYTLHLAGVIKLLDDRTDGKVTGVSWNSEVPDEHNDILLIHKCLTPGEPPFFLEDAISAEEMIRLHPQFRVIISGDYHVPFVTEGGDGNVVVNCGTLLRNKKNMLDYTPTIYRIGIGPNNVQIEPMLLPVQPAKEVFNLDQIEYDKEHGITIDTTKLKELMHGDSEHQPSLREVVKMLKPQSEVDIDDKLVEEVFDNA